MEKDKIYIHSSCLLFNKKGKSVDIEQLEDDFQGLTSNFRVKKLIEEMSDFEFIFVISNENKMKLIEKAFDFLNLPIKVETNHDGIGIIISDDIDYLINGFNKNQNNLYILSTFRFLSCQPNEQDEQLFAKVKQQFEGWRNLSVEIDMLYQLKQIIPIYLKLSKLNTNEEFNKAIASRKKIMYLCRKDHDVKAKKIMYVTSEDERLYYLPHIGGTDVTLNKQFDGVFFNIKHDLYFEFKPFVQSVVEYCKQNCIPMIDDFTNIDIFFNRSLMVQFIENFVADLSFDPPIKFPTKTVVPYNQLSSELIKSQILEVSLEFPIILKFDGTFTDDENSLKSKMFIISNELGVENVVKIIKSLKNIPENLNILISKYINHDGIVYKIYRFNKQTFVYPRGSFPNYENDKLAFMNDGGNGYLEVYSNTINSPEFKKEWSTWNYKDVPLTDYSVLQEVAEAFEKAATKSLFGMDILYDKVANRLYLIDVNYFPGYKELVKDEEDHLKQFTEHIIKYI